MEPPRKRPRLSHSIEVDDHDPDFVLQASRARNDFRLKSTFEAIFEKYGQDFSGVGDEIDLETGEIVVDNGHLLDMRSEQDIGYGRNDDLSAFTANLGGDFDSLAAPSGGEDDSDSFESGLHEKEIVTVDVEVQSDDDLDSLLGSFEDDVRSKQQVDGEDMRVSREEAGYGSQCEEQTERHDLPSEDAILRQFGPALGPRIARLVSNVRTDNDSCVEEAWRGPDLPAAAPGRRPVLKSLLNLRQERSLSPPSHTSIWASARSRGRPKKLESAGFRRRASAGGCTLAEPQAMRQYSVLSDGQHDSHCDPRAMRQGSVSNDGQCDFLGGSQDEVTSTRIVNITDSNRSSDLISGGFSFGKNGFETHINEPLATAPSTLDAASPQAFSSRKRKTGRTVEEKVEDIVNNEQHFPKKQYQSRSRWKQIAELNPGADIHTLVSQYYSQPSLISGKQKKPMTRCVRWTQKEEELLRHLKLHPTLTYAQLVEYFPGRTAPDIRSHDISTMGNVKSMVRTASGPPYTPQEDELLLQLRGKESVPWKDIPLRFPGRSRDSLTWRYYKVLPSSHLSLVRKQAATVKGPRSVASLELQKQEDEPRKGEPAEVDRPAIAVMVRIIQECGPGQTEALVPEEVSTPVISPPSSTHGLESQSKLPTKQHTTSAKGQGSQRYRRSAGAELERKDIQLASPKSTPASSPTERRNVTRRRTQSAKKYTELKGSMPGPKVTCISSMLEVSDGEDELSSSVNTLGKPKNFASTTPNAIFRQCGKGSKRCGRQFCFRCK